MKKNLLPLLGLFVGMFTNAGCSHGLAIYLDRMPIEQVIDMYGDMTGRTLIVSKHVRELRNRITIPGTEVESEEAQVRLVERALLEQASVVITELGNQRYSVTFNDALPAGGMTNILNYPPPPQRLIHPLPYGIPSRPRLPSPPLQKGAKLVEGTPK